MFINGISTVIGVDCIGVLSNIYVLASARWVRRKLSPNLRLCLSLTAADTWSGVLVGLGLIFNSYIPQVHQAKLQELNCFRVALEAFRIGSLTTSAYHLLFISVNHYIGTMAPLRHKQIMSRRVTNVLILL